MHTEVTSDFIRNLPLLTDLSENYIGEIVHNARIESFEKGTFLFRRGKPLDIVYFLLEGSVDLVDYQYNCSLVSSDSERALAPLANGRVPTESAMANSDIKVLAVDYELLDLCLAWASAQPVDSSPQKSAPESPGNEEFNLRAAVVDVEEDADWFCHLLTSPSFKRLPPSTITELFTRFEAIPVKAGDVVLKEGEEGDYFYVVEKGGVNISDVSGQVNIELKPGEFFGEEALLSRSPRNATAVVTQDGILQRLTSGEFQKLLNEPAQTSVSLDEVDITDESNCILDVRLPIECKLMPGSCDINIPLNRLRDRIPELDKDLLYLISDNAGRRSQVGVFLLVQSGCKAALLKASPDAID